MTATHLFFEIAGHAAALPLAQVAGVHEPSPLFPLAGFSPALKGLATVGGRVLAVLDPIALVPEEDDNPVDRQPRKTTSPTQVFLILDGPALKERAVWMKWRITYAGEGLPELVVDGQEEVFVEDGKIVRLVDRCQPQMSGIVEAWFKAYGNKLPPADS